MRSPNRLTPMHLRGLQPRATTGLPQSVAFAGFATTCDKAKRVHQEVGRIDTAREVVTPKQQACWLSQSSHVAAFAGSATACHKIKLAQQKNR